MKLDFPPNLQQYLQPFVYVSFSSKSGCLIEVAPTFSIEQ